MKYAVYFMLYTSLVFSLFITFLYLLTNVDPGLLDVPEKAANMIANNRHRNDIKIELFDHVFFDAGDSIPVMDPALYGLDKAEVEEIDFYPVTIRQITNINLKNITGVYRFTRRKLLPPLWPRNLQTNKIGPTVHKVLPLIWPTITSATVAKVDSNSPISTVITSENTRLETSTNSYNCSDTNATSAKPMKRRSVSNTINDNLGSVLLKILDNDGQPRIEIKLGSDKFLQNKTKSDDKPFHFINTVYEDNHQSLINGFTKDTVITIMSNNTVVIGDMNDKIIQSNEMKIENYRDLLSSLILDNENRENNTLDPEDISRINKSEIILSNGNMSLKLLLQNKTRSNQNNTNSSNDMTINKVNAKYDSNNDTRNNSEFDKADTKFNNTKFIESILEEEETINLKGFQETISGSNTNTSSVQTTNKDTGVFIETESDLLNY